MARPSLSTRSGRWLLRSAWTLQSKFVRLMSNLGVQRYQVKGPCGRADGKLRGPILWLGDLRKRKDRQDT